jgi:hypothetical protein
VSEGGLTDGEPMQFAFGNPTQNSGWFHGTLPRAAPSLGHAPDRFAHVQITNKKFLQELIDDYGIDSDIVKIRVRGMFPSMSAKQFISTKDVDAAHAAPPAPEQYNFAPKILTLDNCWEGDDEGVIGLRQGLKYETLRKFAKNDNDIEIANMLARLEDEHDADACSSTRATARACTAPASRSAASGRSSGSRASRPTRVASTCERTCGTRASEWLKAGGALDPADKVLYIDLIDRDGAAHGRQDPARGEEGHEEARPRRAGAMRGRCHSPGREEAARPRREDRIIAARARAAVVGTGGHDP